MTIPNAAAFPDLDAGSLKQIIEKSGSDDLKKKVNEKGGIDDEIVQYALTNPKELGMVPEKDNVAVAASDGDPDLLPFDDDEVKGGSGIFGGGPSYADKAKPDMQQNLREARLIMKSLEEMKKDDLQYGDGVDYAITRAIGEIREKEGMISKCLTRGRGAADDTYRSMSVDPWDKGAVMQFVSEVGRDVLKIGERAGLDMVVSDMRAGRLFTQKYREDEDS
jgi:hypothetical protein